MQWMSGSARAAESARGPRATASWNFWLAACLLVLLGLAIPGCSGCRQSDQEADKKEDADKEKPKPDFEVAKLYVQPSDSAISLNAVKPGHYVATTQQMKANNFDFRASLDTAAVNISGQPLPVDDTPYTMAMSRTAVLPKGQVKNFETLYFVPRQANAEQQTVLLRSRLTRGGREFYSSSQPTTRMPEYQYYFVALASDPDSYGYLKKMPSVEVPKVDFLDEDQITYYRVMLPELDRDPPVPSNAMAWTMIAYVLWDEVDPALLDRDQQQAILDWLHWGGQIIISGPDSLDLLKGSFLEPYLPAAATGARELRQADFGPLNEYWSLGVPTTGEQLTLNVLDEKPLVGVGLQVHEAAQPIPRTGGLVVERQVGVGRIVVTAFPLSALNVVNWGSLDSFFNACLLRRPQRVWTVDEGSPRLDWVGPFRNLGQDASLATTIRYLSRDASGISGDVPAADEPSEPLEMHWRKRGFQRSSASGMGGWNDYSGVSVAVRGALKDAAGITIPKAGFVFRVLAVYLVVLVPVNWCLFRAMGRVEWAWVAAPLIAVVGAVAVVRLAQLDIGFARSRTELATLEIQGDYPRAHLTRYSALYTSLSTSYDVEFDDSTALAQPFSGQKGKYGSHRPVQFYEQDGKMRLSGFQVDSNSTGMVHSEQMFDLGGALRLTGDGPGSWQVRNDTGLDLRDVGVLRKTAAGLERAWIGDLGPKTSHDLTFEPAESAHFDEWDQSDVTLSHESAVARLIERADADGNGLLSAEEFASAVEDPSWDFVEFDEDENALLSRPELIVWSHRARSGEISIGRLVDLASRQLLLGEGDVRLVGWSDQDLPGVNFRPKASQSLVRMLVVAHLRRGPLPDPAPDRNCRAAIEANLERELEEDRLP